MSIRSQIDRINANIADAYTEAEAKGATMPATENSANLADTVASIPTAPPAPIEEKDVNFYDYDGTVLCAYTAAEALTLTALPLAPAHEGLTFQGWNRTLNELKAYVADYGVSDIGATYITDDGVTRLYLNIDDNDSLECVLYANIEEGTLYVKVDGVVLGSATVQEGYENVVIPFTVPSRGEVCVELKYEGESSYILGYVDDSDIYSSFMDNDHKDSIMEVRLGDRFYDNTYDKAFQNCSSLKNIVIYTDTVSDFADGYFQGCVSLKSMIVPSSIGDIGEYTFQNCASLKNIIISNSVTKIEENVFQNCASLKNIIIPNSVTSIGNYAFQNCTSLKCVIIPNSVTNIGGNVFQNCVSLKSIIISNSVKLIYSNVFQNCTSLKCVLIPNSVTYIGGNVFQNCSSLLELDLSEYTNRCPALSNINALADTPANMKILVANQQMLDAFSSATNWSTYADRIQIKEATP